MSLKPLLALALLLGCSSVANAAGFGYPFAEIAKSSCRKTPWKDLGPECKMPVPKIIGADYARYKDDTSYRRVYSVLWGATYDFGWDSGYGSHMGTDIATSEGTPVVSIGEGTVTQASSLSGWGNTVTIKHVLVDGKIIFSNYSHLSAMSVKKGDAVKLGQQIGAVGNTGHSYGNHLHFQIDTSDVGHPYYFTSCAKGIGELKVVNTGMCRDFLTTNTIDPIAFLETGNVLTVPPTAAVIEKIQEKPPIKINPATIKSRQEILDEEAAEYLKFYSVDLTLAPTGTNLDLGKSIGAAISVRDPFGNSAKGNLPLTGLRIASNAPGLVVFPETIVGLETGARPFSVTGKKPGTYVLTFSLGKTVLGTRSVNVYAKGQKIEPSSIEMRLGNGFVLGQEQDFYLTPKTPQGSYLTDRPYMNRYRVAVLKGKAKFCNLSKSTKTECDPLELVDTFEYGYADTLHGYVKGRIVALDSTPVHVAVYQVGGGANPVARTYKDIPVKNPTGLNRENPYYDSVVVALTKNWQKVANGYAYENFELLTPQATELVRRVLAYRVLKAGANAQKKSEARKLLAAFDTKAKTLPYQKWTRGEFSKLLLDSLSLPAVATPTGTAYFDEKGASQAVIATLRAQYGVRWADQFGANYFQPEKVMTVAEAMYLMGKVVKE